MSCAARIRWLSIVVVLAFLAVTHLLMPDPGERAELQYRLVITLGWGHLLAALGRRGRSPRRAWRSWVLALCGCSWAFVVYAALLERWPGLVLIALAISTWHTMENDRALARTPRGLVLAPLPRQPREHLLPLGATAVVGSLALGTSEGSALVAMGGAPAGVWWTLARAVALVGGLAVLVGPGGSRGVPTLLVAASLLPSGWWAGWLRLADLFVLVTLHHLLTWLLLAWVQVVAWGRGGAGARARRLVRRLLLTHLPPMLLCSVLAAVPAAALDPVRTLVLAPGVYLFWSVLHVGQTAWSRRPRAGTERGAFTERRSG